MAKRSPIRSKSNSVSMLRKIVKRAHKSLQVHTLLKSRQLRNA